MSKLMLSSGRWIGRGSYLHKDESLTIPVECAFDVTAEPVGAHIRGTLTAKSGGKAQEFAIWVTPNDTGTYDVAVQFAQTRVAGTAKLESYPNLGMLWSKDGGVQVAFSLFELRAGRGFRGFCRTETHFLSWEIALEELRRAAVRDSANVVSIGPRGRRR
jgi:hypothetical protein